MRAATIAIALVIATVLLAAVSIAIGPGGVGVAQLFGNLTDTESTIVFQLRLPRTIMAILAGASLGVSGALMQTYFRNPLAEPYITGVSAGGALGAVIAAGLGLSGAMPTAAAAFLGAGLITLALYLFTLRIRGYSATAVLLLGMALGTLCGALVWFVLLRLGPGGTDQALSWLLGRVATVGYSEVIVLAVFTAFGLLLALRFIPDLDALLMGEEKAASLGVNLPAARRAILGSATLLASSVVAFCGVIAFVGLIVPHMARGVVGGLHRRLLPVSAIGGATLLLAVDIASRTVDPPREIPLTIITSLIGAPFFIVVLLKTRRMVG